jgi:hypothetical protein
MMHPARGQGFHRQVDSTAMGLGFEAYEEILRVDSERGNPRSARNCLRVYVARRKSDRRWVEITVRDAAPLSHDWSVREITEKEAGRLRAGLE